ncbi:MAG: 3-alpha,7-alpha,12-alpha-trihydroxy-5-beta-cholest-24-enoyl-CoA hydratase [Gammaproteobacteria bacterium]|nr:3-alpha,7-alpha,12-alpha-trihydroxy-5-beta-cholest-24-enoyl-CoA hydratase [Gammaproteobacteria bacterium]
MNLEYVANFPFEDIVQSYSTRDALLYALSVGMGADPVSAAQLRYSYEKDMAVMPAMVTVLGRPGPWGADPQAAIDVSRAVYAEQSMELHQPLPRQATIRAREKILGVVDKGESKGALIYTERRIVNDQSGELLATLRATMMCRGDGGCGSTGYVAPPVARTPAPPAENTLQLSTLPQQALIYRLNGDMNPLHADPVLAQKVGFERPILHGLCSYGFAVHALLSQWCEYDETRLQRVDARFSAPMYPGETFIVESWRANDDVAFRVLSKERNQVVLDNGYAQLTLNQV